MTDGGRERLRLYSNAPPLSWQTFKPIHVSAARARLTDRTPQTMPAFPKYETIILKPGGRLQGEMVEEAESIRAPPSKKLGETQMLNGKSCIFNGTYKIGHRISFPCPAAPVPPAFMGRFNTFYRVSHTVADLG